MTFAIVIPTYNGAKYVREAIDSVLRQTRLPDEIIISDDNSSDDTIDICSKYGSKLKIYQNKKGPSGFVNGWNNAIAHTTSDYISILHQDDKLSPTFLEEIECAVKLHPDVKHLFTPCSYIDGEGNIIRTPTDYCSGITYRFTGQEYANAYEQVEGHIHRCPGVVTHRDIFRQCRYRKEAGHIADDDFFLRVGNYTDVVGILKPLAFYREHKSSETGHLSFLAINKRLLKDYHFQLQHCKENPLMSDEIISIFKQWEAEYIHRLLIFGFKSLKLSYSLYALSKWLSVKNIHSHGNILYDASTIKNKIIKGIRKFRIGWF